VVSHCHRQRVNDDARLRWRLLIRHDAGTPPLMPPLRCLSFAAHAAFAADATLLSVTLFDADAPALLRATRRARFDGCFCR